MWVDMQGDFKQKCQREALIDQAHCLEPVLVAISTLTNADVLKGMDDCVYSLLQVSGPLMVGSFS